MPPDQREVLLINFAVQKGYLGKGAAQYAFTYQKQCEMQGKTISLFEYFLEKGILTQQHLTKIQEQYVKAAQVRGSSRKIHQATSAMPAAQKMSSPHTRAMPVVPPAQQPQSQQHLAPTQLQNQQLPQNSAPIQQPQQSQQLPQNSAPIQPQQSQQLSQNQNLAPTQQSQNQPTQTTENAKFLNNAEPTDGTMFAHYRIEKEIGRGGMGRVYKVYDTKLDRTVALKLISGGDIKESRIKRFMQEAKATAKLRHPNIVEVFEVGDTPQNYFTMEYLQGGDITGFIKKGPLKPVYAATVVQKIAEALNVAHKKGIIHRDIKPSNIMLNGNKEPKLMDFGLSKMLDVQESLSKSGDALGTPAYMSPEQANSKEIDNRSDVYSLGATLYEMITGNPPFKGDSYFDILNQIFHDTAVPPRVVNQDIPRDLEAICLKSMQKKPSARYSSARAFAKDLKNFIERRSVSARPTPIVERIKKIVLKNKTISASVLSLGAIVFTAFVSYKYATNAAYKEWESKKVDPIEQHKVLSVPLAQKTLDAFFAYLNDNNAIAANKLESMLFEMEKYNILAKLTKGPQIRKIIKLYSFVYENSKKEEHFRQGMKFCKKAIQFHPDLAEIYNFRGKLYMRQGIFAKAQIDFLKAAKLNQTPTLAYYNLSLLYGTLKKTQKQLEYLEKTIDSDANFAKAYGKLASFYYEAKSYPKALQYINTAIKLDMKDAGHYYVRGLLFFEEHKLQFALQNFNQARILGYDEKILQPQIARTKRKIDQIRRNMQNKQKQKKFGKHQGKHRNQKQKFGKN